MIKISIIIPAYNEEKRIGPTLEKYSNFLNKIKNSSKINYEILVVINNTKDRTKEIVKKYQKIDKNIKYLDLKEGGKGLAVKKGFIDALKRNNDLIGFVDADCSTSPEAFYDLITNLGDYDGSIASRYMKKSIVQPKQTLPRIIVSRIFNFAIRSLFFMPYSDTQCGAKIFKRKPIEKVVGVLEITKWAFDVELLYKIRKLGFKIKEVPTVWSDREYSKINFANAGPKMLLAIVRLRLINSRLNLIVRLYDKLNRLLKKGEK